MIHIFRKIRNQLIKDNSLKKYLIYAIGEVFLVVVGILLALQFNNWNIEKENAKKEEWYLINIVEDIEYQKGDLKDQIKEFTHSIQVSKQLLEDLIGCKALVKLIV